MLPDGWETNKLGDVLKRVKKPVNVELNKEYREIGIRSHGKGIFHKEPTNGKKLGNKSVFWVEPNCLVLNIVFAWEQAVAKTSNDEKGFIASHRFPMYEPKNGEVNVDFLLQLFNTKRGKYLLELASPGGAGRNKTLGQKEFAALEIALPTIEEQNKIVSALHTWDKAIEQLSQLIEAKREQKHSLMQRLLTGKQRLSGFEESEWKETKLGKLLKYEQPTKYLVTTKAYNDDYKIPVLTANKSFILGYTDETEGIYNHLPAIIFDDFTTANKFVDFQFKVKSSAIKILTPTSENVSLYFLYSLMQLIHFPLTDHQRYWISEYQHLKLHLPEYEEQNRIATILSAADKEISQLEQKLANYKEQKKGLMQQLLTGKKRVPLKHKEAA